MLLKGFESHGLYKIDLLNFVSLGCVNQTGTRVDDTTAYSAILKYYVIEPISIDNPLNPIPCDTSVILADQHDSSLTEYDGKHDSTLHYLVSSLNSKESSHLWHMRLGHPSTMPLTNFICLYNLTIKHVPTECDAYAIGKSKRNLTLLLILTILSFLS